jgi:RimJ/RimL family protein N-acetyltransferase
MVRIMERSGMTIEARFERHYVLDGKAVDVVFAARFRQSER